MVRADAAGGIWMDGIVLFHGDWGLPFFSLEAARRFVTGETHANHSELWRV